MAVRDRQRAAPGRQQTASGRRAASRRLTAALLMAARLVTAAAEGQPDPSGWPPLQCQCDADPAVVALCSKSSLYPPDIAESDWETIGDQYYQILTNQSLTDAERQTRYEPLMTQSGLTGDNFTMFADKYAALQELPTAEQLSASASYCSVQFSNETGLLPCLCAGGGMAELTLNITDPTSDEFSTDPDTSTQLVLAVVEERLRATLGLWVADVAIDSVESGSANIHITFSTLSRMKIEQQFDGIEGVVGQSGPLSVADGSQTIELGAASLNLRVLACSGAGLTPPADLPTSVTIASTEEVLAGARARFTCPAGEQFSSGQQTVSRRCSSQERLEPASEEQLTCVNVTEPVEAPEATTSIDESSASPSPSGSSSATASPDPSSSSSATSPQTDESSAQPSTYEPEHYEEINVEWNDGKSFKKVDPNKPNLLMRITVPAASVIFVMLVIYLLCTRPESCMCNTCGGGKLEELK